MKTITHDFLVFIGRFQPYHYGHQKIIQTALKKAQNVIILIGSPWGPRSIRNPFTFDERKSMITKSLTAQYGAEILNRIDVLPIEDFPYNNNAWIRKVQQTVDANIMTHGLQTAKIGLIGHSKDQTSFYLKLFPQWGESINVENFSAINATDIRTAYFNNSLQKEAADEVCPPEVSEFLNTFSGSHDYLNIKSEHEYIVKYKEAWKGTPYPVTFVTVDAVLTQSGHVLLVVRGSHPGKGLYALPGGFLEQNDTIEDSVIRELQEETKIKLPEKVLRGHIKSTRVFDAPNRSARGRVVTHAFHIDLPNDVILPKVKGGSDARAAKWIPFGKITPDVMFEDHYYIVHEMLNNSKNIGDK